MERESVLWHIQLFAGLRLTGDGQQIDKFQTRKTEALLGYLALHPERTHAREQLCALLWPDSDPDAARNRLSQAVGWLRTRLEPPSVERGMVLIANRQSVGLDPHAITSDVGRFENLLRSVRRTTTPTKQRELLEAAITLYTGHFLPVLDEEWAVTERQRLREECYQAIKQLISLIETQPQIDTALFLVGKILALDPLSEEIHAHLIHLYLLRGDRAAAEKQYQEMATLLQRALGQIPSDQIRSLLHHNTHPLRSPQQPVRTVRVEPKPSPLPVALTRFFGREQELATVIASLTDDNTRFVTITGLGGTGKTRLAMEAAQLLVSDFNGLVWFISLTDLNEASLIPTAISAVLQLTGSQFHASVDAIVTALAGTRCLLILDNLEHLTEEAGPILRLMLERLPQLWILATSRHVQGIEGEREISLPPLPVPGSNAALPAYPRLMELASVQLFLDRARAVRPDFQLTVENAHTIARLCERLEGLPLAIELCAAWAQTLTPEQMLEYLNRRFDLLVSRRRDIPVRHRTLRATMEYSYLLLPLPLQKLLVRLSVFKGGWTLDAALALQPTEEATRDRLYLLNALTELRERSLISAQPSPDSGNRPSEMRYRMLETVRAFVSEQHTLAVEATLKQQHFHYFLQLAQTAEPYLNGNDPSEWIQRLDEERENLRSALAWSEGANSCEQGLQLATALTAFWEMRGYSLEGLIWIEKLLRNLPAEASDEHRGHALLAIGQLARARTEFHKAELVLQEALALYQKQNDLVGAANTLMLLGTLANSREDNDRAQILLDSALVLARQVGDTSLVARVLANLATVAMDERNWDVAWSLFSEVLTFRRAEGNRKRMSSLLTNLGLVARYQGQYQMAKQLMEQGLAHSQELADRPGIAISLLNLGTVHRHLGMIESASTLLTEATEIAYEVDDRRAFAWCIKEVGHIACSAGDWERGIFFIAASERFREILGISFKPADPTERERDCERGREVLGDAPFQQCWQSGSGITFAMAYQAVMQPEFQKYPSNDEI